jgi:hypothetical protein
MDRLLKSHPAPNCPRRIGTQDRVIWSYRKPEPVSSLQKHCVVRAVLRWIVRWNELRSCGRCDESTRKDQEEEPAAEL